MEQHGYVTTFDGNLARRYGGLVIVVMKLAVKRDTSPRTFALLLCTGCTKISFITEKTKSLSSKTEDKIRGLDSCRIARTAYSFGILFCLYLQEETGHIF